ncbi:TPA: transposase [Legionella pneumophila subsp. pneumophila]|nr:transposase [Legionella pneumophila]HAT8889054.1 transposase [Legionella pneumophila subsp. pneumophila]HAT8933930.1 transposase [Legionella pneumophila subsp. pneumophila]
MYVSRIGVSWQDNPGCYGNWNTIYTRFKHRSENGLFCF